MSIFPQLYTLQDILPFIKDRKDILVLYKKDYIVVNYTFFLNDTFDCPIRRECRGLIFDTNGKIISRPFHKFFNINETEESQWKNIDFSQPYIVQEKIDGSMVRPFLSPFGVCWATRMGETSIAKKAEKLFATFDDTYAEWIYTWLEKGYTPIFEYIGPDNQIVVPYKQSELVLLALRHNTTGNYKPIDSYPGTIVKEYTGTLDDISSLTNKEGVVILFNNGSRYKVKTQWYRDLHSIRDEINDNKSIIKRTINKTLDDILPFILSKEEKDRILQLSANFTVKYQDKLYYLLNYKYKLFEWLRKRHICGTMAIVNMYRKEIATQFVPTLPKRDRKYLFMYLDGKDIEKEFANEVLNNLSSDVKYINLMKWIEGERDARNG